MSLCAKPWAKRFMGGCKEVEGLLIGVPGWWAWGKEASPLGKCGQAEAPPLLPRGWRAAPGRGRPQEERKGAGSYPERGVSPQRGRGYYHLCEREALGNNDALLDQTLASSEPSSLPGLDLDPHPFPSLACLVQS